MRIVLCVRANYVTSKADISRVSLDQGAKKSLTCFWHPGGNSDVDATMKSYE